MLIDNPIKDHNCEILRSTIFNIQVCSKLSEKETLEWLRKNSPAGTVNNWGLQNDISPVQCVNDPEKMHYIFNC